jgi:hypothetical protein
MNIKTNGIQATGRSESNTNPSFFIVRNKGWLAFCRCLLCTSLSKIEPEKMNNPEDQELFGNQERFKQLQDFLKQTGFTGNVPFTSPSEIEPEKMNNSEEQKLVGHQERFKKLQDFLKQTGFTTLPILSATTRIRSQHTYDLLQFSQIFIDIGEEYLNQENESLP